MNVYNHCLILNPCCVFMSVSNDYVSRYENSTFSFFPCFQRVENLIFLSVHNYMYSHYENLAKKRNDDN